MYFDCVLEYSFGRWYR